MPRKKATGRGTNGAGTIRKKNVIRQGKEYTYWEARFTEGFNDNTGKQIQRSITGKTQKEIAQKLRQITTELDNGTYRAPIKMTVEEWLSVWLNEYTGAVKPSTHYLYERTVTLNIIPSLGRIKLENLTPQMIQKYYNNLLHPTDDDVNPLSPKSIKNVHGILHKALQQAVIVGYLKANPANGCVLPRIEKPDIHPMDEQQTAAFVQAIRGGDDIRTVQESLCHATAAFTLDVYGHVTAQMKRDSAGRMEKLIQSFASQ